MFLCFCVFVFVFVFLSFSSDRNENRERDLGCTHAAAGSPTALRIADPWLYYGRRGITKTKITKKERTGSRKVWLGMGCYCGGCEPTRRTLQIINFIPSPS